MPTEISPNLTQVFLKFFNSSRKFRDYAPTWARIASFQSVSNSLFTIPSITRRYIVRNNDNVLHYIIIKLDKVTSTKASLVQRL